MKIDLKSAVPIASLSLMYGMYVLQYLRPFDIVGLKLPLFSAFNACLITLLIADSDLSKIFKFRQIQLLMALTVLLSILTLLSDYPGRSVMMFTVFVQNFTVVFAAVILIDSKERFRFLVYFLASCAMALEIYVFLTHKRFARYELFNLSNFLVDPNDLGLYLNMMLPWAMVAFSITRRVFFKLVWLGGILSTMALSLLTYSRGGFLGLIVTLGVFVWFHPRRVQMIVASFVMALIGLLLVDSQWLSVMSTATDTQTATAVTRMTMWKGAWQMFVDNPFGNGPGTVGSMAYEHIPNGILGRRYNAWQGEVCHSYLFTALAEWGIIGTVLFFSIVVCNLRDCFRFIASRDDESNLIGIACLASLAGFLVSGLFLTVNYYPHWLYLTAFICSWSYISTKESK